MDGPWLRLRTLMHPELGEGLENTSSQMRDVMLALFGDCPPLWEGYQRSTLSDLVKGRMTIDGVVDNLVHLLNRREKGIPIRKWFAGFVRRWIKAESAAIREQAGELAIRSITLERLLSKSK